MKKIVWLLSMLILAHTATSQVFKKKFTWKDKSFKTLDVTWVDIDNDSLLDVVVLGREILKKWKTIFL
jgi:hypothetical protein